MISSRKKDCDPSDNLRNFFGSSNLSQLHSRFLFVNGFVFQFAWQTQIRVFPIHCLNIGPLFVYIFVHSFACEIFEYVKINLWYLNIKNSSTFYGLHQHFGWIVKCTDRSVQGVKPKLLATNEMQNIAHDIYQTAYLSIICIS